MTSESLIESFVLAAVIAGLTGWLLKRLLKNASSAATFSSALAAMVTFPVLLHSLAGWSRIVTPREALEWLPIGCASFAIATLMANRDVKHRNWWLGLGCLCGLGLAVRLMWGSVFLKGSDLSWINLTAIAGWGATIALSWAIDVSRTDNSNLLRGILQIVLLLVVAVNLGLSGSMTYLAAGLLCVIISVLSWLGSGQPSCIVSVAAMGLLGLGPTFSETSWWVALLLLMAILGASISIRCQPGRRRKIAVAAVLVVATAASFITGMELRDSLSGGSESSGYEAYR